MAAAMGSGSTTIGAGGRTARLRASSRKAKGLSTRAGSTKREGRRSSHAIRLPSSPAGQYETAGFARSVGSRAASYIGAGDVLFVNDFICICFGSAGSDCDDVSGFDRGNGRPAAVPATPHASVPRVRGRLAIKSKSFQSTRRGGAAMGIMSGIAETALLIIWLCPSPQLAYPLPLKTTYRHVAQRGTRQSHVAQTHASLQQTPVRPVNARPRVRPRARGLVLRCSCVSAIISDPRGN